LKHASGKYIVHCDSDDWVDTDLYEKMYRKALAEGADMVCVPFASEIPGGRGAEMIFPVEAAEPADYIAKNLGSHLNSLCSKMYKREIALAPDLEVPEQISMGEDLLRNTQMLGKCRKISFVTDSCYHYRCNASSITHTFAEKHYRNMKGILDILQQKDPAGYSGVILYIRTVTLLALLRNIHKDPALKPLFTKEWRSTSFKERMKMIFTAPNTLKGRVVLSIVCISKSLAFALLKRLYQSECR
jgi:glycosyltransferase involved in cell wall biosynthesis